MTLVALVVVLWLGLSGGATLAVARICRAGHHEDLARGYVGTAVSGSAAIPAPRQAAESDTLTDA